MRILAVIFLVILSAISASAQQPNVLFIIVDDLRTSLGCYGDTIVQTPNIDRLAETSRIFSRAYCQQAVCGPSRASLLTGCLPDNLRVWHNRNLFRSSHPDLITMPQFFKSHGYQTLALGKVFSGDERELDPVSWSEPEVIKRAGWKNSLVSNSGAGKGAAWEAADVRDEDYPDGKLANLAIEKLETLKAAGKPFFMSVGFFKPHLPFNAPNDHRELGGYRDIPHDEQVDRVTSRTLRHGYYACVSYTDAQIGKLLNALEQLDLDGKTIVVLCADHGYALGEKNRWCKGTNFERDTCVPLLIRSPGLNTPGSRCDSLVELVDLYPTLASLAGLPVPEGLSGQSLVPMLDDPNAPGRIAVISQFARPFSPNQPKVMGYSLRTSTHRYTRWVSWPDRNTIAEELYDYRGGPSTQTVGAFLVEERNIIAVEESTDTREQLRQQLNQMLEQRTNLGSDAVNALPSSPAKKKRKRNKS